MSRKIINPDRRDNVIDEHVWAGRRATLMPGINIGKGSIIGTGSVVTHFSPSFTAVAGKWARVDREGVRWSRPWAELDPATQAFRDNNQQSDIA